MEVWFYCSNFSLLFLDSLWSWETKLEKCEYLYCFFIILSQVWYYFVMHSLERTRAFHWFLWKQYMGHWCYDVFYSGESETKVKLDTCFLWDFIIFFPAWLHNHQNEHKRPIFVLKNTNNRFRGPFRGCLETVSTTVWNCRHFLMVVMFFKINIKFITMPARRRNSAPVVSHCTFTNIRQQICRMIIKRAIITHQSLIDQNTDICTCIFTHASRLRSWWSVGRKSKNPLIAYWYQMFTSAAQLISLQTQRRLWYSITTKCCTEMNQIVAYSSVRCQWQWSDSWKQSVIFKGCPIWIFVMPKKTATYGQNM